jgi:glycosyltransferase involved in cell wall biosynthesis
MSLPHAQRRRSSATPASGPRVAERRVAALNEAATARGAQLVLRLTYLHGRYPVLTETFIDREIRRLLDRGVDLRIVSIRRPSEDLSPAQRAMSERVEYLLPASPARVALALLWALVGHPRTSWPTLAWLLSRDHGGAPRRRTALHFATGVYAAWQLRDRRGVHIHAHFADRAATVALVASRLLGTTYSVTAHAREIYVAPVLLKERLGEAAFAVTCTEYNRRHLAGVVGTRAARRLLRLYHGIDLSVPDVNAMASQPDDRFILSVAQLWERKGIRYLVEACGILRDRGTEFRCEIVGDGPLRLELQGMIDRLALGAHVRLTGPLPLREVIERYRRAGAFVLPCIVTEEGDRDGIPNVILEAMALGVPVISTPVSGIPEVVRDGETGLLAPERDAAGIASAVERVFADRARADEMASRGRDLVRAEFDLERNVDRLLEQFRSVAGPAR